MSIFNKEVSDFKTGQTTKSMFGWTFDNREYPAWKDKELALKADVDLVSKKLNLILKHLDLEYVPESEEKKPAHLAISASKDYLGKKKRGRPRKVTV